MNNLLDFSSVSAIVITVTQILMQVLSGPLAEVAGKWRLLIVTGLSLVLAIATGLTAGMTFVAALLSGAGLAALQVFVHQIYTQFFQKAA
jgi:low affinity Fe/Cu permease